MFISKKELKEMRETIDEIRAEVFPEKGPSYSHRGTSG